MIKYNSILYIFGLNLFISIKKLDVGNILFENKDYDITFLKFFIYLINLVVCLFKWTYLVRFTSMLIY